METTMSRRAALLTAAASTAALAVPVAQAAEHQNEMVAINIEELAVQFRDAAMKLDPRISECWVGYDEIAEGPRDMRVMSVYFSRKDTPFVRPAQPRSETITDLYARWREACYDRVRDAEETEEQGDVRFARYAELQDRITAMRPRSARELAMQMIVETDNGGSSYRPEYFDRLRLVAEGI